MTEGRRVGPDKWTQFSDVHWGRLVLGKRMDYWPSTGRFKWNDHTMFGDPEAFIAELMDEQKKLQSKVIQQVLQGKVQ